MSYNPKTDYLKEDPILCGQDYSIVSFINPTDHVLNKNLFYVNNFMVQDINKMVTAQAIQMARKLSVDMRNKVTAVLDKLKYSLDAEDKNLSRLLESKYREMVIDEDSYVEECRRKYALDEEEIADKYKMYLSENRLRLNQQYDSAHDNQTSLRGFKIRGSFARLQDAQDKAKSLRDNVEPGIHAYVVPTGTWFPVDMEADEVQDQEYMLPQLNELMGKYHEGIHARNQHYAERQREMSDTSNNNRQNTKSRLKEKLRKKRQAKVKAEVAELRRLNEGKN